MEPEYYIQFEGAEPNQFIHRVYFYTKSDRDAFVEWMTEIGYPCEN